ncbi:hypothetical protein LCI18_013905 [Fusarium solani-melongenae]|uniref:Uncharacterized protein n=1 Tax=Fusarium solani subsp. cucurbitae TaxID=2747967 RepID=A0ACD3ZPG4_FUSSC|nr:hypothetical protein LCI18_013905 [Fusarium solani-melongenae]
MVLSDSAVAIGVWNDYSRNGVLANTLTLKNRDAVALLAFLATLVGIVGVRSWRITRFILFTVFAPKPPPQADLGDRGAKVKVLPHHVILRNSETATGAAFGLLNSSFLKGNVAACKDKYRVGSAMLSVLALGHGLTFIALSILTSQIVLGRTVVSRPTSTCGIWSVPPKIDEMGIGQHELDLNATLDADNYVQNCYFSSEKSGIFDCQRLASQSIPFSVSEESGCPLANNLCRTETSFVMDTGNISVSQLGINAKLGDQLYFRRRSTCAPIREEPFYVQTLASGDFPSLQNGENMLVYRFGVGPDEPRTAPLRVREELYRGQHGPSLVFLSGGGITFTNTSDDPVWSVHTKIRYPNGTWLGVNYDELPLRYSMDRDLNVIGCDERFQICLKSTNKCSPWSGLLANYEPEELDERARDDPILSLNIQMALDAFIHLVSKTSIPNSIGNRAGSSSLRASRNMRGGEQFHLDPEQWKTELTYWFALAMARLQLDVYKTIEKPEGLDTDRAVNRWAGSVYMDTVCGRIKFDSPNHTSLSFAGVMVILVVSASLIFLSFFELLVGLLPEDWRGIWALQWESSDNLVLLKERNSLVNESAG